MSVLQLLLEHDITAHSCSFWHNNIHWILQVADLLNDHGAIEALCAVLGVRVIDSSSNKRKMCSTGVMAMEGNI